MSPIGTAEGGGITPAVPQRVFLSHTSDLGKRSEPGSFVAAAVEALVRARHAVTDRAYLVARDTSPALGLRATSGSSGCATARPSHHAECDARHGI